jgi:hypothetical protein
MMLSPDQRRALELLDRAGPRGCTEAVITSQGFKIGVLIDLIRAGHASAGRDFVRAGDRMIEVTRVRITDAGRRALTA